MVELDVEARQGDSGGPIFNQRGELAGVLFGAGQGTTLGSFAPRVSTFLSTLAPDIGQAHENTQVAIAERPAPNVRQSNDTWSGTITEYPSSPWRPSDTAQSPSTNSQLRLANSEGLANSGESSGANVDASIPTDSTLSWSDLAANRWYDPLKSALAGVGLVAILLRLVKAVR
jgi:hypothetical protein